MLEGLRRRFRDKLKLYVYPMKEGADGAVVDAGNLQVSRESGALYDCLRERGQVGFLPICRWGGLSWDGGGLWGRG
jgi:hypothetical protein